MFRRMLEQQLQVVEDGGEPMNVHRDPVENEIIVLPCEYYQYPGYEELGGPFKDYKPGRPDVQAILSGDGATRDAWSGVESRPRVWGSGSGDVI
jgi:hypothetical protein